VFSLLASNPAIVAVPFQVCRETPSSRWVGIASLIQLPFLITDSPWRGTMGDRRDRRTLMQLSTTALGLLSAALAVNAHHRHQHLAYLLVLAAIGDGLRYVCGHAIAQAVDLVDLNAMVFGRPRALFPAVALTLYHGGPRPARGRCSWP
jgi:MFS family permease